MSLPMNPRDTRLNLHPGEWYFGMEYLSLYTLLGSCVALSVWHPRLKLGGLCHYLLPTAPEQRLQQDLRAGHAGRYAVTVLALLKQRMLAYGAVNEYQIGLFGGSDSDSNFTIGKQNIVYAQQWLAAQHINLKVCDVGGNKSRTLILNVLSGELHVKSYSMAR